MVDTKQPFRFIGHGVYSMAEAGRLTKVPVPTLKRWARGYDFIYRGKTRHSPPIVGTGLEQRGEEPIFEFRDIMEMRFLFAFRKAGVSWRTIRLVAAKVHQHVQHTHPFATKIFRTDGRRILLQLISKDETDRELVDLLSDQYEWDKVVEAYLVGEKVEFNDVEEPVRWWPLGPERQVVVDPVRSFGAPIVPREGVQTFILARAVAIEGDAEYVAKWYDVDVAAVRDAIDFENGDRAAQ
jgi:uncharacterized protein (DUF433 family)